MSFKILHPADAKMFQNQNFSDILTNETTLTDTRKLTWSCELYTGASSFGSLLCTILYLILTCLHFF
jgi:hypothetical protein